MIFRFSKMVAGAAIQFEEEAPGSLPLLYVACRRHKRERDYDRAWKAIFPAPTKAPADKLCERMYKLYESGNMPKKLDSSCPYVFRTHAPVFKRQKERLNNLVKKMEATAEKQGACPRDEYRYFLNLAQVQQFVCGCE